MPKARKSQISLEDTAYYHCISRCVRRAYLCGQDPLTGRSFEHRRAWVEKRMLFLAQVFAIDICAYAVMSNHTHLVLHVDREKAQSWSLYEIISRWHRISKGAPFSHAYLNEQKRAELTSLQWKSLAELSEQWRERLYDISWFMRMLNEPIARQANQEDGCTGRFWEGRFKSQALLDDTALAACMAYVDLNPIRAGVETLPEKSQYTSIKKRCEMAPKGLQPKALLPFIGNHRKNTPKGLPFTFNDYLMLLDLTGRIIRPDKNGYIPRKSDDILFRLGLSQQTWESISGHFGKCFSGAVGKEQALRKFHNNLGSKRTAGLNASRKWLSAA